MSDSWDPRRMIGPHTEQENFARVVHTTPCLATDIAHTISQNRAIRTVLDVSETLVLEYLSLERTMRMAASSQVSARITRWDSRLPFRTGTSQVTLRTSFTYCLVLIDPDTNYVVATTTAAWDSSKG